MEKNTIFDRSKCFPGGMIASKLDHHIGIVFAANCSGSSTPDNCFDLSQQYQLVWLNHWKTKDGGDDVLIQANKNPFLLEGQSSCGLVVFRVGQNFGPIVRIPARTTSKHPYILRDHPGDVGGIHVQYFLKINDAIHSGLSGTENNVFVLAHRASFVLFLKVVKHLVWSQDTNALIYGELQRRVMWDDAFSAGSVNQLGIDFYFIGYRSIDTGEVMDSVLFATLLFKVVDGTWEKIELLGCNLVVDKVAIILQNFFLVGPVSPRQGELCEHQFHPVAFELSRG
mmetsp:Transcript_10591/g.26723  ORF Transcript_10591/g.26723 Transcript_10591/m.26723 type:complete len:283 (+) Transcript_10591:3925-4773(+)